LFTIAPFPLLKDEQFYYESWKVEIDQTIENSIYLWIVPTDQTFSIENQFYSISDFAIKFQSFSI
jgi:hypothetical protein